MLGSVFPPSGPGTLYLALIYLNPGQRHALRQYETRALPFFRRHGGRFERILSPAAPGGETPDPEAPDEIHLLRFQTADGLEALRRDPEMAALAPLRRAVVRKVLLLQVEDIHPDTYFGTGS
jgi:uncharacterized protein (DUF1330 family)